MSIKLSTPDRDAIKTTLKGILTSQEFSSLQVDVSTLTDDTSFINDIALDSLQLLEFVVAMEKAFVLRLDTKKLKVDVFDRFDRVVDLIERSLANS